MQSKVFYLIKTLLLFSIFITSLNAEDILTNYRLHGIKNLKKQLDRELYSKKYWINYIKDKDTSFGYIEKYKNILTCDKSNSTLSLYMKDKNNNYILTKKYNSFTGKNTGDKVKEGDLRTPIGIYRITKKLSNIDSFYGPMAFVTSYPNLYDRYNGKDGHGIWIHGRPLDDQERDSFTKGCIAIKNKNIECLDRNIDIDKTILIINEEGINKNNQKEKLATILSQLYEWRYYWIYNQIDNYLNFYSKEFIRFDGMNLTQFTKYKKRVFRKGESKTIIFTDINVIKYPNKQNLYKITFKEQYRASSFSFTGEKTLIVKLQNNQIHIITEQ